MDDVWPKKKGAEQDMMQGDLSNVVSHTSFDRVYGSGQSPNDIAVQSFSAHKGLGRQPSEESLSLRGWTAHIGIRAAEGVAIHPGFAEGIVNRLVGRQAFVEVGRSSANFYFAVEDDSAAVKRRVGEFALDLARLVGGPGEVETLRLLKVKPQYLPD